MFKESSFNNEDLLNRICEVYGFSQKIQLANHFDIAASSLQNRYKRGNMSYDFAVHCALETGASITWLMTGEGQKFEGKAPSSASEQLPLFTLSEGKLIDENTLLIDSHFFSRQFTNGMVLRSDGKLHFVERDAALSDGQWLVDIEGMISVRELTLLPGKKLHVAGGKVPFECGVDEIKMLGRVVGVYSEVN
ncbi:phage repressor protein CI [Enterobacter sp.]|uniref:phage repressor protein CI n=1 Tax=Enterobacter sp. TaxID=42895 RepID=UPI00296F145A|nr:phage repressor protein CI [Enterobacter sp.]